MNIQTDGQTVTVTMTAEEAEEMRNAFRFAGYYWQVQREKEDSDNAKAVCNRIALKYGYSHNQIADIIGY